MSRNIDEKIVQMQFDNKEFERNVQTSINTLGDLKKSLQLNGATKGLENIDYASKKVNMDVLGSAVESVRVKFSALEVIAVSALNNITNSVLNTAKRIGSSLTIDPVRAGFSEYETQINAIQTILANTESKGTTLKDVNKALDELNAYADKTIYNFTEMTRNIGTFTAAGTDLDTSVNAIQGIANLAAISGSTSQQASVAMYQLSQALASGTVKLMDWNSVVNAGMGGQVFQDALKETARVHGIKIDEMIEKEGSFRETLKDGWITSEILTETLHKFTLSKEDMTEAQIKENEAMLKSKGYTEDQIEAIFKLGKTATDAATKVKTFSQLFDTLKEAAQSGWTQTWEIIVGDFEEAKDLLTKISDVIGGMLNESAKTRNEMLQGWKDLDGRKVLIEALKNSFEGLMSVVKSISDAFRDIFPRTTSKQLFDITEKFRDFTKNFKEWAEASKTVNNIKRIFKGLFAALDIGVQIFKAIASGFKTIIKQVAPLTGGLFDFVANIGDAIVKLRDFVKAGDLFNKIVKKISSAITTIVKSVKDFVSDIATAIKEFAGIDSSSISEFVDTVKKRFSPLTKLFESIVDGIRSIADVFKNLFKFIGLLLIKLGMSIGNGISKIIDKFDDLEFGNVVDNFNKLLSSGILVTIEAFFIKLLSITDDVGGFLESFTEIFENIGDVLKSFAGKLKAEALMKIATAIAVLVAAIFVLSTINPDDVTTSLTAISTLFIEVLGTITLLSAASGKRGFKAMFSMSKMASDMMTISIALLILATSLSKIAKLETKGVITGLIAIAAMLTMMIVTVKLLSTEAKNTKKMTKGLMSLVVMAVAIRVLAGAVAKLSSIDGDKLRNGLVGVGVLLVEILAFMKLLNGAKINVLTATALVIMAASMIILASAVKKLGSLDFETLSDGLISVGILLAGIVAFTKYVGNPKKFISTSIGITILSASMLIFAEAISRMGNMSWEQIGKGLLTMAGALAIMIATLHLVPKGLTSKGVGLVVIASSLVILGAALSNMGGMSWGEMGRALISLSVSLAAIVVAMKFMTTAIPGALAMLILAPALMVLALSLKVLGSMSIGEVILSLVALAGAFAVLGVAAYILTPIVPIVLALGVAMLLLGAACASIGAGVMAFAAGCASLAISGAAGAAAVRVMIESILGLIPLFIKSIGDGIVAILKLIADSGKEILDALTVVLLAIIRAIEQSIPPLIKCLGVLLDSLLQFIVEYIPKIIDAGMRLIIGFLKGIADNIDKVVEEGANVVVNFINGIASKIPDVIQSGVNIILSFINGIADAIRNNTKPMIDAVDNLMDSVFYAIKEWIKHAVFSGGDLINGLIEGIRGAAKDLWTSMVGVVEDAWEGVKDFFGIHSPSTVAAEAGMFIDKGLAIGLEKFAGVVGKSATNVGETAMDSLSEAISGVSEMVSNDMDSTPVITPVIDLTEIQNGEKQLSKMFNKDHTISVNSANIKAASIASGRIAASSGNNATGKAQQGAQISFTQNNYSPKALSRSDIYRQTKNQFSAMKGALVGS